MMKNVLILLLIALVAGFLGFYTSQKGAKACKQACMDQHYIDSHFVPFNIKSGSYQEKCYCLLQEDLTSNKATPGKRIY